MAAPPASQRASNVPAGTPSGGGNGMYIAASLVLLLGIAGVVWFIQPPPAPARSAPSAAASVAATAESPALDMAPPPPPPEEDAAAPAPSAAKVATAAAGAPCGGGSCGGTATSELQSALRGRGAAARRCYEKALQRNSALGGKMRVQVRVDTGGTACSVSVVQDDLHSPEVTSCVLNNFRGARLPAPSGGCAELVIPLNFSPQEK